MKILNQEEYSLDNPYPWVKPNAPFGISTYSRRLITLDNGIFFIRGRDGEGFDSTKNNYSLYIKLNSSYYLIGMLSNKRKIIQIFNICLTIMSNHTPKGLDTVIHTIPPDEIDRILKENKVDVCS